MFFMFHFLTNHTQQDNTEHTQQDNTEHTQQNSVFTKKNILTALLLALFLLFTLAFSCISHTIAITKTGPAKSIVFHFAAPTTLTVGNTGLLSVFVQPFNHSDGDVVWTTNPENLLTIIPTSPTTASYTAVGIGTVVITASVGNDVSIESESIEIFELELVGVPAGAVAIEITNVLELRLPDGSLAMGVRWSSSHPGIVEISETTGIYRAISAGTVTIFYTYGTITGSTTIEVTNIAIPADSIAFTTPPPLTLEVSDTGDLSVTVTPSYHTDGAVMWQSDNPDVLSVTSTDTNTAEYEALNPGTVRITATVGTTSVSMSSDPITVSSPATSIEFATTPPSTLEVSDTGDLSVTVTPSNHTDGAVVWQSSDPSVLSVTSTGANTAEYEALNPGTVRITATVGTISVSMDSDPITVSSPATSIAFVTTTPSTLEVSDDIGYLSVTVEPSNHSDGAVVWESSDPSVLSVTSTGANTASYSAKSIRTVTITASVGTASVTHTFDIFGVDGSIMLAFEEPPPRSISPLKPGRLFLVIHPTNHGLEGKPTWQPLHSDTLTLDVVGDGLSAEYQYKGPTTGNVAVTITFGTAILRHIFIITPR